MTNTVTRSLIETFVRKKIQELADSPKRSTRNLVDMALTFSNGRFQKHFFEIAQDILQNEDSTYYQIAHSLVTNVDTKKLLSYGMNAGYNSFTYGAGIIRKYEKEFGFNIPWCITLELNGDILSSNPEYYHKILNEGKALGIYTYHIFSHQQLANFIPIIDVNRDCAFNVFCTSKELDDDLLDISDNLDNIMFIVEYSESGTEIFRNLRSRKYLYSTYFHYADYETDEILNNDLLCELSSTNAIFAVMIPNTLEYNTKKTLIAQYVSESINSPLYPTLPWDFWSDNRRIDSIISDDSCFVWFDSNGNLLPDQDINIFSSNLMEILKQKFPKK